MTQEFIRFEPVYTGDTDACLRILRPYFEYEDFDVDELRGVIESKECMPLAIIDIERERVLAVLTLNLTGRVCEVRNASGTGMDKWILPALETLTALAREAGCDELTIKGRPGWRRELARLGFRTISTVMGLRL